MEPIAREARLRRVAAAAAIAILLWASAFVAIRIAARPFAGGPLALFRFGVASVVFAVASAFRRPRLPSLRDLAALFCVGLVGVAIYHAAVNEGERTVSAGIASLLVCTSPVYTALLAAAFLRERLSARALAGVALAFSGVALLAFGSGASLRAARGTYLVAGAAFAQGLYFVLQKPLLFRLRAFDVTAWSTWLGTAALAVFAPSLLRSIAAAPRGAVVAAIYLGVLPGALANGLWAFVLAHVPASRAASWIFLVPPLALAMGWLVLGETPALASLAGGAIALAGVALTQRARGGRASGGVPASAVEPHHVEEKIDGAARHVGLDV